MPAITLKEAQRPTVARPWGAGFRALSREFLKQLQASELRALHRQEQAIMRLPQSLPFAPYPDEPSEGFSAEQIRILSGQLIKR
jgi:hypothetical protein